VSLIEVEPSARKGFRLYRNGVARQPILFYLLYAVYLLYKSIGIDGIRLYIDSAIHCTILSIATYKQQINIKLPPPLIDALRLEQQQKELQLTDLIQGFVSRRFGYRSGCAD